MTGVINALVCVILSGGDAYKQTLAANRKEYHVAAAGCLFHYLSGPLPYI